MNTTTEAAGVAEVIWLNAVNNTWHVKWGGPAPTEGQAVPLVELAHYEAALAAEQARAERLPAALRVIAEYQPRLSNTWNQDIDAIRHLARAALALRPSGDGVGKDACDWSHDMEGNWSTDCGHLYTILEGSPHENEMAYCCFCGKRTTESKVPGGDDD